MLWLYDKKDLFTFTHLSHHLGDDKIPLNISRVLNRSHNNRENKFKYSHYLTRSSKMCFNNQSIQSFLFLAFMSLVPKISGDLILTAVSAPDLVNEIMVGDAQVSEPKLQGHSECNRIFKGGLSAIPGLIPPFPDEGIILSSGNATDIIDQTGTVSTSWDSEYPGDPDITELIGQATYDACVLEFNFVCSETDDVSFSFDYVFGSEEYPVNVLSSLYYDGFGFFLNGENLAVVPGTNSAVSINSINENQHAEYYVDNPFESSLFNDGPYPKFEANGFTKTMKAIGTATAGSNSIKLAIADGSDNFLDSWVLIKGTSFTCTGESANPSNAPSDQPSKLLSSSPSSHPSYVPSGGGKGSEKGKHAKSYNTKSSKGPNYNVKSSKGPTGKGGGK